MLNLFKYKTPGIYAHEFEELHSSLNLKQIRSLCIVLLCISIIVRIIGTIYHDELYAIPRYYDYNLSNILQFLGSISFLLFAHFALGSEKLKTQHRNLLTLAFVMYTLTITFNISYIYSLDNVKNTLTVFLMGIVIVSIFFTLHFRHICTISGFVVVLFVLGMLNSELDMAQKLSNFIAGIILAFVLFICSRYNYFLKSQHFVQIKLLEEKNKEIQSLNHQKGEILGFVAHDLRNPLNNIEALSSLVLSDPQESSRTEVQLILTSAQHAKDIINDLIEVVQERKAELKVADIDLVDYLRQTRDTWQANVEKPRKINFHSAEEQLIVRINSSKFARVIDNLIGNGLKFSAPQTPINVELLAADKNCLIKIRDYGIGIPEDLMELLFDQFSKAGRLGLNGEKSMGLGLHISRDIIVQHGGTLEVESKENEGTTFIISLPIKQELV